MRFGFGPFQLDVEKHELRLDGELVALEPQVFRLLVHLVSERARVVTKDELIEVIWDGRFVSDSAVSSRIKSARQALGDSGKTQTYIKTIHGQGFRFIAPVDLAPDDALATASQSATSQGDPVARDSAPTNPLPPRQTPESPARGFRPSRLTLAILAMSAIIFVAVWLRPQPSFAASDQIRVAVLPIENQTGDPEHDWAEIGLMSLTSQTLHQGAGLQTVSPHAMAAASEDFVLWQDEDFVLPPKLRNKLVETRGVSHFVLARLLAQAPGFAMEFVVIDRQGREKTGRVEADELASLAEKASREITKLMPAPLRLTYDSEIERDPFVAEAYARGRAFQIEGKVEQARNLFGVAAEQAPDDMWLRYEYALSTRMMGDLDDSEAQLIALQSEAEAAEDNEILVAILNGRSIIHMNRRETDKAIALLEMALPLAQEVGNRTDTASVLINLGIHMRRKGDLDSSDMHLMRALSEYDAAGISSPPGALLNSIGMVRAEQGKLDSSREYFERARARFELDGANRSVAAVVQNIADIQKDMGAFEEAKRLLDRSLEIRRELNDRRGVSSSLASIASLLLQLGQLDDAETTARELLDLAEDQNDLFRQAMAHAVLGEIYAARGDADFAAQHYRRELMLAERTGRESLIQTSRLNLARALHLRGDAAALELVNEVLDWAESAPSERHAAMAHAALGQFSKSTGDLVRARSHYEAGLTEIENARQRSTRAKLSAELGLICADMGDIACARDALSLTTSIVPVTRSVLMLEATIAKAEGQTQEAASLYQQARDISGEHWTDADAARLEAVFDR